MIQIRINPTKRRRDIKKQNPLTFHISPPAPIDSQDLITIQMSLSAFPRFPSISLLITGLRVRFRGSQISRIGGDRTSRPQNPITTLPERFQSHQIKYRIPSLSPLPRTPFLPVPGAFNQILISDSHTVDGECEKGEGRFGNSGYLIKRYAVPKSPHPPPPPPPGWQQPTHQGSDSFQSGWNVLVYSNSQTDH